MKQDERLAASQQMKESCVASFIQDVSIRIGESSQAQVAKPIIVEGGRASGTTEATQSIQANGPIARAKGLLSLFHSIPNGLNFEHTKALALECVDEVLERWLPDGTLSGREYKVCNPTREDGSPDSFSINVETGVWGDFATGDVGGDLISLVAYLDGCERQTDAALKILEFIAGLNADDAVSISKQRVGASIKSKVEMVPIMPIPVGAERTHPKFFGMHLGSPTFSWAYKNAEGQPLCYVNRFETDTGKTFLPLTYCKDASGREGWKSKAPSVPRPAYGLDRLAARPTAPVLFVEGEKAADAAHRLLPKFVAVTTMNGAKSPEKTDFTPFAGRKVYIAPDNDAAGIAYKDRVIELVSGVGAQVAGVMRIEKLKRDGQSLAEGYDLADAEAEGWTSEMLAAIEDELWETVQGSQNPLPKATLMASAASQPNPETDLEFAIAFANQSYGGKIASVSGQILAYSEGCWVALDEANDIKRPILRMPGVRGKASRVNAILDALKIEYSNKLGRFERKSPLICLKNGTLNPVTGELLAHAEDHYLSNRLEIAFDQEATCELWLQTLNEIFAPDADKDQKIQLLQEFLGYCLIPDTRQHKFLWMVGAGGNGKSLILAVLNAVIGKANISHAQIERLQDKFVRAELQGMLVNISSEMSAQATISDGYLKQIVAGDIIEAERKYERSFSFKPYARLIGATNVLPRLLDHSDGFFRRAIILRLNRQFTEAEQDKQRESRLMAELPGILNWCIAGLQNLLERSHFIIPTSAQAEVDGYRVNSDPVRQFAEEQLQPCLDKNDWVRSSDLYQAYREWSGANGYMIMAINQFTERLSSIGYRKKRLNDGRYWEAKHLGVSMPCFVPAPSPISPSAGKYKV